MGAVVVGLLAALLPLHPGSASAEAAVAKVVDGRPDDWVGTSSLLSGRTAMSRGELIYQDHVYDDYGAGTSDPSAAQFQRLEPTDGRYRYPTDEERFAGNVADLFQLRVAIDGDRVVLLAWLDALRRRDTTVVSVAFDVDARAGQAARPWPHASGLRASGADVVVTAWGTGADLVDLRTGRRTRLDEVAADVTANAIEVAVPVELLGGERWRVWAATGLWDRATAGFMAVPSGAPTPSRPGNGGNGAVGQAFNVAFRDHESGAYYEERQAAALRTGDLTSFAGVLRVGRLRGGESDPLPRPRRGEPQAVIVDEGSTIGPRGEGASFTGIGPQAVNGLLQGSASFQFYGRWQPYTLYVPRSYDGSTPIPSAAVLHGRGGSHVSYNTRPGFLRDIGEGGGTGLPGLALITPLARGASFYADAGERSTLLALDDAARRVRLDPERQYLTGYSMGGYGVFRLAVRYPDRWAAAVSWAGFTGEWLGTYELSQAVDEVAASDATGLREQVIQPLVTQLLGRPRGPIEFQAPNGDPVRALEALEHLPILQLGGTADELVPITGQLAAAARLRQLGYRQRFDLYPAYEHLSFALVDQWADARAFLGDRRREERPRHIAFAATPGWEQPGSPSATSAWWVSGLRVRAGADDVLALGRVDATSAAIAAPRHRVEEDSGVGALPTPHVYLGSRWSTYGRERLANRLDLRLENLADVSIDLAGAGLRPQCLKIGLSTDGPAVIRFPGTTIAPIAVPAGARTLRTAC